MLFCQINKVLCHISHPGDGFLPIVRKSTYLYPKPTEVRKNGWIASTNHRWCLLEGFDDKLLCQKWHTSSQLVNYFFRPSSTLPFLHHDVEENSAVKRDQTQEEWFDWYLDLPKKKILSKQANHFRSLTTFFLRIETIHHNQPTKPKKNRHHHDRFERHFARKEKKWQSRSVTPRCQEWSLINCSTKQNEENGKYSKIKNYVIGYYWHYICIIQLL